MMIAMKEPIKNATAHIAEGNGIGTMTELAKYIRTTMKAENVLTTQSVQLMKTASERQPRHKIITMLWAASTFLV